MFDKLKRGASYTIVVCLMQNKQEIPMSALNLTTCVPEKYMEVNGLKQSSALRQVCCFAEPEVYPKIAV